MADDTVDVHRLLEIIAAQQESIERLTRIVETNQRPPSPESKPSGQPREKEPQPGPPDWNRLTGDARQATWEGLANFVEETVQRLGLQLIVMPCWWKHPEAVEELTALWMTHRACFRDGAPIDSGTKFLGQMRRSVDELRAVLNPCREGHVDSIRGRAWMSDAMRAEFAEAVRSDVMETVGERKN
jgi:hypothetical protein